MFLLPLASISFGWKLFVALWTLLAVGLILVVLIQKGRGGGLGAAFGGGGGGSNSLLGTKTGDFLTWVTICLVALFLLGAIVMGKYMRPAEVRMPTPPAERPAPIGEPGLPPIDDVEQEADEAAEPIEQNGADLIDELQDRGDVPDELDSEPEQN